MTSTTEVPSAEILKQAGDLEIFDENGTKIKFSSLYADKQTLVIFIRHFLCGNCMEYIKVLSSEIDPSELSAKGVNIAIIGCGGYEMIKNYVKEVESKYPVYADPSQKLYTVLGMIKTLALGKKPQYMSFGVWGGIMKGISNGLKAGFSARKGGDVTQVGGEFLLGPGDKGTWAHKMETTRDHTEIPDLRKVLNLDGKDTNATASTSHVAPTKTTDPAPAAEPVATAEPVPT